MVTVAYNAEIQELPLAGKTVGDARVMTSISIPAYTYSYTWVAGQVRDSYVLQDGDTLTFLKVPPSKLDECKPYYESSEM